MKLIKNYHQKIKKIKRKKIKNKKIFRKITNKMIIL